jgi:hypothetical protein
VVDEAVSGGESSTVGASRRCLAPLETGTSLSVGFWNSRRTSVRMLPYKGAGGGGPLPTDTWDAPDLGVQLEGEGDPDSVWPV